MKTNGIANDILNANNDKFLIISRISNIYESSTKVINNIVSIIVEVDCSSVDSCNRVTGVVRILIAEDTIKIRRITLSNICK